MRMHQSCQATASFLARETQAYYLLAVQDYLRGWASITPMTKSRPIAGHFNPSGPDVSRTFQGIG